MGMVDTWEGYGRGQAEEKEKKKGGGRAEGGIGREGGRVATGI